jgi:hypothetical protein
MRTFDSTDETLIVRRPHTINPHVASVRVVMIIHNWWNPHPHPPCPYPPERHRRHRPLPGGDAGLSVIVNSTMRVLRRAGVHCECWPAKNVEEIFEQIERDELRGGARVITHIAINTYGFLPSDHTGFLASQFPEIEFVTINHSGQSFLQIDPPANTNIKKLVELQLSTHNIAVAGNNSVFVQFIEDCFGVQAVCLPNLYDTTGFNLHPVSRKDPDPLRVGTFGATRPAKNQFVAEQAALGLARRLGVRLEWHVNGERFDSEPNVVKSRRQFLEGNPSAMIVEHPWKSWAEFCRIVESMDLLIMPSTDETFCCVVADGIARGVPSVTGPAMDWTPANWQCTALHDPAQVMRTGLGLLHDRNGAVRDGRKALQKYVDAGTREWVDYLCR